MTAISSIPPRHAWRHGLHGACRAPRILVGDAHANTRWLVATALRCDGHEVVEVQDGGRMLVHLTRAFRSPRTLDAQSELGAGMATAAGAYDLVVADQRMPVCSGIELLEVMRRVRWGTPFILLSSRIDPTTRERASSLGAAVFERPFDIDDLRRSVRALLSV